MKVESNFKQDAVSPKGPAACFRSSLPWARHAQTLGVAWSGDRILHEPDKNIKFGVYHLSQLIDNFDTLPWALYAYNSGSTKAKNLRPDASSLDCTLQSGVK